ncbi:uncharacterized protein LOC109022827 [Parus major]|uniref:uncharacterized protein LOC109022827 n=1 Tax=Parus major TaxID=9157 RepID=UPI0008F523D6|nr:uncharacterized protein LOC109022827 [Parus major]
MATPLLGEGAPRPFRAIQSPSRRGGKPSFYWTVLPLINVCGAPRAPGLTLTRPVSEGRGGGGAGGPFERRCRCWRALGRSPGAVGALCPHRVPTVPPLCPRAVPTVSLGIPRQLRPALAEDLPPGLLSREAGGQGRLLSRPPSPGQAALLPPAPPLPFRERWWARLLSCRVLEKAGTCQTTDQEYVARATECKQEHSTLQITKAKLQKDISCPSLAQRPVPTEHLAGSSAAQTPWMLKSRGSINSRPSRGRGRQTWSRNAARAAAQPGPEACSRRRRRNLVIDSWSLVGASMLGYRGHRSRGASQNSLPASATCSSRAPEAETGSRIPLISISPCPSDFILAQPQALISEAKQSYSS